LFGGTTQIGRKLCELKFKQGKNIKDASFTIHSIFPGGVVYCVVSSNYPYMLCGLDWKMVNSSSSSPSRKPILMDPCDPTRNYASECNCWNDVATVAIATLGKPMIQDVAPNPRWQ
jgi:tRNA nucleotidyltransferase (CCA-adding enzyme)